MASCVRNFILLHVAFFINTCHLIIATVLELELVNWLIVSNMSHAPFFPEAQFRLTINGNNLFMLIDATELKY